MLTGNFTFVFKIRFLASVMLLQYIPLDVYPPSVHTPGCCSMLFLDVVLIFNDDNSHIIVMHVTSILSPLWINRCLISGNL